MPAGTKLVGLPRTDSGRCFSNVKSKKGILFVVMSVTIAMFFLVTYSNTTSKETIFLKNHLVNISRYLDKKEDSAVDVGPVAASTKSIQENDNIPTNSTKDNANIATTMTFSLNTTSGHMEKEDSTTDMTPGGGSPTSSTTAIANGTTTMTFNHNLTVTCVETMFVECKQKARHQSSKGDLFRIAAFRNPSWNPGAFSNNSYAHCPYNNCISVGPHVTENTDAVSVYGVGLSDRNFPPLPRWPHQVYVFSTWESPPHTHAQFLSSPTSHWNSHFNLTMTYRVDADVFVPYGRLTFKPLDMDKRPNYFKLAEAKTRTALWFVSNCGTPSRRNVYVKKMQEYIDVDIYGACGTVCPSKQREKCFSDLLPKYKFYLSFENSLCKDYITEKLFKLFGPNRHIIPVVRGGADYDKYLPPFTFINAANFKSPKDLALHLKNLATDLETYSKYLEYKDLYAITGAGSSDMSCGLCEYLNTHKGQPKVYPNMKAWLADGICHPPNDLD